MAGSSLSDLKRMMDRGFHPDRAQGAVKTLRAGELRQLMDRKDELLVINVLDQEAYDREHIPGSQHIANDEPDFTARVEKLAGSKARPIVVYGAGRGSPASPSAAKQLVADGFTDISDFAGGLAEWKTAGLQVRGTSTAPAEP